MRPPQKLTPLSSLGRVLVSHTDAQIVIGFEIHVRRRRLVVNDVFQIV